MSKLTDFERVRNWNKSIGKNCPNTPTVPTLEIIKLVISLIQEELDEMKEACGMKQLTEEELEACENNACETGNLNDAFAMGRESVGWSSPVLDEVDLVAVADSLSDLTVVVHGGGALFGINLDETFEEVMTSNDSKLIDGWARESDGKWQKGPSYRPPNLEAVIERLYNEPME